MNSWTLCMLFVFVLVLFSLSFVFGKVRDSFRVVVNIRISSVTKNIIESQFD
jgi:hypothetical protein